MITNLAISRTQALACEFLALVEYRLEEAGFELEVGRNMHRWSSELRARGALANPQFRTFFKDQSRSSYALIYRHQTLGEPFREGPRARTLMGSITWRTYQTRDYVEDFENGSLWYDAPESVGFQPQDSGVGDRARLSGMITSRGGIASFSPKNTKLRLSWWLCSVALAQALIDDTDFSVGVPLKLIADGGLPARFYGYRHLERTKPIVLPFCGSDPVEASIAWSSRFDIREEVRHRFNGLQVARDQDLGRIVDTLERQHEAHERALHDRDFGIPSIVAAE